MLDTPGVYIRETSVGLRSISGVSLSNTAFVGAFQRGPLNKAVRISSLAEYERTFGGAWPLSDASQAVSTYFLNGGSVAFIVRVADKAITKAEKSLPKAPADGTFKVSALSEGKWGGNIRVGIAVKGSAIGILVREYSGNTVVREEVYEGLSSKKASPNFVASQINAASELIRVDQSDNAVPEATNNNGAIETVAALQKLEPGKLTSLGTPVDGVTPLKDDGTVNSSWAGKMKEALTGNAASGTGIYALNAIVPQTFNLMCLPDTACVSAAAADKAKDVYEIAETFCEENYAFLLVDTARGLKRSDVVSSWLEKMGAVRGPNAACYYPRLSRPNPNSQGSDLSGPTSGAIAGLFARTDANVGVWRAAAGTDTIIAGGNPEEVLTDRQHGPLNLAGLNVIRTLPIYGNVVMGARTMDGVAGRSSPSTYVPVRRLTLFIEASLKRGLSWVPFEPNDESTWSSIRLSVNSFMSDLHQRGAFQGASARDAYLVKCGSDTTNQNDINRGIVNIIVGFQPVQPIEFVIVNIQIGMQIS